MNIVAAKTKNLGDDAAVLFESANKITNKLGINVATTIELYFIL